MIRLAMKPGSFQMKQFLARMFAAAAFAAIHAVPSTNSGMLGVSAMFS
jgi:hypothetical protein